MHIKAESSPFGFFFVQRRVSNKRRRHISGAVVTRILVVRLMNCSILGRRKSFFFVRNVQTVCGAHPASYSVSSGSPFPGVSDGYVKLTTQIFLVGRV